MTFQGLSKQFQQQLAQSPKADGNSSDTSAKSSTDLGIGWLVALLFRLQPSQLGLLEQGRHPAAQNEMTLIDQALTLRFRGDFIQILLVESAEQNGATAG